MKTRSPRAEKDPEAFRTERPSIATLIPPGEHAAAVATTAQLRRVENNCVMALVRTFWIQQLQQRAAVVYIAGNRRTVGDRDIERYQWLFASQEFCSFLATSEMEAWS